MSSAPWRGPPPGKLQAGGFAFSGRFNGSLGNTNLVASRVMFRTMFVSLFLLRLNLVPVTAAILEIPSQDELTGRANSSSPQPVDTIFGGAPGQTVTLTLSQLVLTGNERLTLQGTMTTHFVIDISQQFSLSGHSSIVLSGGIQWNNVIFNLIGRGAKMIMRGHSQMTGIIDAPERRVRLTGHALVVGEVWARRIRIRRFARIITPPIISP